RKELTMRRLFALVALTTLALGPLACAASTEDAADPAANEGSDEAELKGTKVITEADNGKTVDIAEGQAFTIKLTSNATTGYKWFVLSVDRTLGEPSSQRFLPPKSSALGAAGTQYFHWNTNSPLDVSGQHTISLGLERPWAERSAPAQTFEVTVNVASS